MLFKALCNKMAFLLFDISILIVFILKDNFTNKYFLLNAILILYLKNTISFKANHEQVLEMYKVFYGLKQLLYQW